MKHILKQIAREERIPLPLLTQAVARGETVVLYNKKRKPERPMAIGKHVRIKVNTNIGASSDSLSIEEQLKKLDASIHYGTDTVMDLSVSENLKEIRRQVLRRSSVPVGTVPLYEAAVEADLKRGSIDRMKESDILSVIEAQAREGVDFFTLHAGITYDIFRIAKDNPRLGGIVSRGGAIVSRWMYVHKKENPLYTYFSKILGIARKYNVAISLGDGLRPGALHDSTDRLQLAELSVLGDLVKEARKRGVGVIVEGPGHIRINEIALNVELQKKSCAGAPFYILGPLVTDIAAGYDHITAGIGSAIAALHGADFLCVVTPAEHLRQPTVEDIREGVIASRIAAHSVDLIRNPHYQRRDDALSEARFKRAWGRQIRLALDPEKALQYHKGSPGGDADRCSMCGKYCSFKITEGCSLNTLIKKTNVSRG